jgi:hypothetical protein
MIISRLRIIGDLVFLCTEVTIAALEHTGLIRLSIGGRPLPAILLEKKAKGWNCKSVGCWWVSDRNSSGKADGNRVNQ